MPTEGSTLVLPPVAAERSESSCVPADGAMCASAVAVCAALPRASWVQGVVLMATVAPMTPVAAAVAAITGSRPCFRVISAVARKTGVLDRQL